MEKVIVRVIAKTEIVLFTLFFSEISMFNSFLVAVFWISLSAVWEEGFEEAKQTKWYAQYFAKWTAVQSLIFPICMTLDNQMHGSADFGSRFWINTIGFVALFFSFLWLVKFSSVFIWRCLSKHNQNDV